MKKSLLLSACLLVAGMLTVSAQDGVKLTVLNAKGKPASNVNIAMKSNPLFQSLDKTGSVTLLPLMENDTIFLTVGSFVGSVPIDGASAITVVFDKDKMTNKATGAAYEVVKLPPFDPNNISKMPGIEGYHDLYQLIAGKFPAIQVAANGDLYMREKQSTNSAMIYMLTVLDGSPAPSFETVNASVRPKEVKSIVLKRNDILYGTRGAGGVLEITRVKGGEE